MLNYENVLAHFSANAPLTTVSIDSYQPINRRLAKVVCTVNSVTATGEDIRNSLARTLSHAAGAVFSSFRAIPGGPNRMVGFVALNNQVRAYTDSTKMRVVAANLFLDEEDQTLWGVTSSGDQNFLVRQGEEEDLSSLMVTASLSSTASYASSNAAPMEFVAYVHPETAAVRYGFVVTANEDGTLDVIDEEGEVEAVSDDMVIEAAHVKEALKELAAEIGADLPADSSTPEAMKKYYQKLYSYAPDFARKVIEQIDQHAVA